MPKFAHMSDIHIGAFRQPELKAMLLKAFDQAIETCIERRVDFVVMAGDIFDSNIPDLSCVTHAVGTMRKAIEHGIRFYVVYGSHDFSPNYSSIVDVLESAGLLTKVEHVMTREDGRLELSFVHDKSGASLCGISGKKLGLDRLDYELLDLRKLEAQEGFKIFVFHGAVEELKPSGLSMVEAMTVSNLPSGFNYYAGGHVHETSLTSIDGHPNIAYPGSLFGTDFRDLDSTAKGGKNGFYIVDFDDDDVRNVEFVQVTPCQVTGIEVSAQGKTAAQVYDELQQRARETDIAGKVVLVRTAGELSQGRTFEVDFSALRRQLLQRGALTVLLNYYQLTSKEQAIDARGPEAPVVTEQHVFEKMIGSVKVEEKKLQGEEGVRVSMALLKALKEEKKENETKSDYQGRIEKTGFDVLGLKRE